MEKGYIKSDDFYCDGKNWYYYGYKDYIEDDEDNENNEIIYEDDIIIVYDEYNPASYIYDNDEIKLAEK